MALSRAAYRNFTASDIDGRISNTCTHSVNGSNVDCTDVTISKVRTVLSSSAYNLSSLCTSTAVNRWSAWGPTVRTTSGSGITRTLVNSAPSSSYSLGSFAGYHHDAPAPAYTSGGSNTYVYKQSGSTHTISCTINIGEMLYNDVSGVNTVTHVHFSAWDGSNYWYSTPVALSSATDGGGHGDSIITLNNISITNITATTTYTCKIWFCDNGTFDYQGNNVQYKISTLGDWTVQVKIAHANHFYVNAAYNDSTAHELDGSGDLTSGDWILYDPVFYPSTGRLNFTNLQIGGSSWGTRHTHVNAYCESGYFNGTTWVVDNTYTASSLFFDDTLGPPTDTLDGPYSDIQAYPSGGSAIPTLSGLGDNTYGYRIIVNVTYT